MRSYIFLFLILLNIFIRATHIQLLIKIPTRSRPEKFFTVLDKYYEKLSRSLSYHFIISCDEDDPTMNNRHVINRLKEYPHLNFYFGKSISKVEAYNCDIEKHLDFDVLLVTSDDMEPIADHFDQIIMENMKKHFPDFDGILNFNDGFVDERCNTLPIFGKKFYERFGYIYHHSYKSVYCDEELTLISRILRKEMAFDQVIIKHNHPVWSANYQTDKLYQHNDSFYYEDQATFKQRRYTNFNISPQTLRECLPKDLSILICGSKKRKTTLDTLYKKLQIQIKKLRLQDNIEVILYIDNDELSIGTKKNLMLRKSKGMYVCFVDETDDVHEQYIKTIYDAISSNADCISLTGTALNADKNSQYLSLINPIKRNIAIQFLFPNASLGHDKIWSELLAKSELIKTELQVSKHCYTFLYTAPSE